MKNEEKIGPVLMKLGFSMANAAPSTMGTLIGLTIIKAGESVEITIPREGFKAWLRDPGIGFHELEDNKDNNIVACEKIDNTTFKVTIKEPREYELSIWDDGETTEVVKSAITVDAPPPDVVPEPAEPSEPEEPEPTDVEPEGEDKPAFSDPGAPPRID